MGHFNAKLGKEEYQKKAAENTQYSISVMKTGTY
jgi:hypothetical protein